MSHYAGQRLAFLTQHGKEAVIAPALEPALGCKVEHISDFDTDQLGTFTWNTEMLVLMDDRLEVAVVGIAQVPARCDTLRTATTRGSTGTASA